MGHCFLYVDHFQINKLVFWRICAFEYKVRNRINFGLIRSAFGCMVISSIHVRSVRRYFFILSYATDKKLVGKFQVQLNKMKICTCLANTMESISLHFKFDKIQFPNGFPYNSVRNRLIWIAINNNIRQSVLKLEDGGAHKKIGTCDFFCVFVLCETVPMKPNLNASVC